MPTYSAEFLAFGYSKHASAILFLSTELGYFHVTAAATYGSAASPLPLIVFACAALRTLFPAIGLVCMALQRPQELKHTRATGWKAKL